MHMFFFHCYILYKWYNNSIIICTNSVQTHAQTHQGFPTQGRHDDLHPSVAAELNHLLSEFFWKLGNCISFYTQVLEKCRSTAQYSVQQVLKEEEPPSISRLPPSPPAGSRGQRPFLICDWKTLDRVTGCCCFIKTPCFSKLYELIHIWIHKFAIKSAPQSLF